MNEIWIITAPGGRILTAATSRELAEQIIDAETIVHPGVYKITHRQVIDRREQWAK